MNSSDIVNLVRLSKLSKGLNGVPRICLHSDPASDIHVMIQCLYPYQCIKPHRSFSKTSSIYYWTPRGNICILQNDPDNYCFDEIISKRTRLESNLAMPLLTSEDQWRSFVNLDNGFSFLVEVRLGPYLISDTEWYV